jgi:hypothetical protein
MINIGFPRSNYTIVFNYAYYEQLDKSFVFPNLNTVIKEMMDTFWKQKLNLNKFNKIFWCVLEYPLDPKYSSDFSNRDENLGMVYKNKTYTQDPVATVQVEQSISDTMSSQKETNDHGHSALQASPSSASSVKETGNSSLPQSESLNSIPNDFLQMMSKSSEDQSKLLQFQVAHLREQNKMFEEMISHIYDTMMTSDNPRLRSVITEVYAIMSYKRNDTTHLSSDSGRPQKRQLVQLEFNENIPLFD